MDRPLRLDPVARPWNAWPARRRATLNASITWTSETSPMSRATTCAGFSSRTTFWELRPEQETIKIVAPARKAATRKCPSRSVRTARFVPTKSTRAPSRKRSRAWCETRRLISPLAESCAKTPTDGISATALAIQNKRPCTSQGRRGRWDLKFVGFIARGERRYTAASTFPRTFHNIFSKSVYSQAKTGQAAQRCGIRDESPI